MKKLCTAILAGSLIIGNALSYASAAYAQGSVREQDDFYSSVNSEWLSKSKIPDGFSAWGNFEAVDKQVNDDLRGILTDYAAKNNLKPGSDEKKLADLYTTALDYKDRDAQGLKPIQSQLDAITKIADLPGFMQTAADMTKNGDYSVFGYGIFADLKDSNTNILNIDVGSLGMGNRDYYMDNDDNSQQIQTAYAKYLSTLFKLSGDNELDAKRNAKAVYDFEKSIASSMLSVQDAQDIEKQYNVYTIDQLKKLCPAVDWDTELKQLGLDKAKKIIVSQPEYFKKLNTLVTKENLSTLKLYLKAILLRNSSSVLTSDFEKATFAFESVFTGVNQMRPQDERAFDIVNGSLGGMLGKIYVEKYFKKEAKEDVKKIAQEFLDTYEKRINALDWMSPATKAEAVKKLKTMDVKIGYPDQWDDYSDITIKTYQDGGSLYADLQNIGEYYRVDELAQLDQPVDKTEWGMTPQTINAYYNPSVNEIVFPAGILQEPFYKYGGPLEENLGGIGAIIGHEISHAFDDEGSKFDEKGNMKNWWAAADYKKYAEKTKKLADQYDKYEIIPGQHVNGNMTLGENIADLGAVSAALDILKASKNPDYDKFFTAYAKSWRNIQTDELTISMIKTDPHSPGKFRVNGILTNVDEFYKTYNVTAKDKMFINKENRISIW